MTQIKGPWRIVKRANQNGIRSLSITNDRGSTWTPNARGNLFPISPEHVAEAQAMVAALNAIAGTQEPRT